MIIRRIKIQNYKTYLSLDLDLTVMADRPIILIGGMNGGGKTTLFEAICGALYGLDIADKHHFKDCSTMERWERWLPRFRSN